MPPERNLVRVCKCSCRRSDSKGGATTPCPVTANA
nr:MAG TPA: hypothetical protein [Caudoviricetes sp.]